MSAQGLKQYLVVALTGINARIPLLVKYRAVS